MYKCAFSVLVLLFCFFEVSAQTGQPMLIGRVSVSQTNIAFTYAGKSGSSKETAARRGV